MILSASRIMDIPTFYSEWFFNRIKAGFLYVRNPMNAHQISRIDLSPEVVDCIVFWTKNPIPILPRLSELDAYKYYFQFTLTGYGKDIETNLPDKKGQLIPAFQELARRIGRKQVIWRYDPIVFTKKYTPEYHIRAFTQIAETLDGCTEKCVISFVDIYAKNRKNMQAVDSYEMSHDNLEAFAKAIADIARSHGMSMATCAEVVNLEKCGIEHNCCIDKKLIEEIIGCDIKVAKDKSQRPECGCMESVEIGSYNTCLNGCKYCYANYSPDAVKANCACYDPASPILCGTVGEFDKITERKMKSLKQTQLSFRFDGQE